MANAPRLMLLLLCAALAGAAAAGRHGKPSAAPAKPGAKPQPLFTKVEALPAPVAAACDADDAQGVERWYRQRVRCASRCAALIRHTAREARRLNRLPAHAHAQIIDVFDNVAELKTTREQAGAHTRVTLCLMPACLTGGDARQAMIAHKMRTEARVTARECLLLLGFKAKLEYHQAYLRVPDVNEALDTKVSAGPMRLFVRSGSD
jgi:hypothetical protein